MNKADTPKFDVDFAAKMLLDGDLRSNEIESLRAAIDAHCKETDASDRMGLQPGVSVIIPSWLGSARIVRCLTSLVQQTVTPNLLEIIVVINGERDNSMEILTAFAKIHGDYEIRVFYTAAANAGNARNLGITAATREYITFVDDDDYVGPAFIENLLSVASENTVAICPIINVAADGTEDSNSSLNELIRSNALLEFPLTSVPPLLGFNACKLFPTRDLTELRYPLHLRSGEDVCFMSRLATARDYLGKVGAIDSAGAYYRVLRDESISRQDLTFDFAVDQRLAVIADLEQKRSWKDDATDHFLTALIASQAGFVGRYLEANSECRGQIEAAIDRHQIRDFPWRVLNKNLARDLVVSYCFAPYSDTSAVVAAKAIVERGRIVDVISNRMNGVRRIDSSLNTIASRLIDHRIEIDSPPSFAGWKQISDFVTKGIKEADRQDAIIGGYKTLYSRVLWPGSHFLSALFKLRHPQVVWTAEFSDPVSSDSVGKARPGDLVRDELFEVLRRGVAAKGFKGIETDSIFEWCEYITYVLADEVVFTNINQRDFMISQVDNKKLRDLVFKKSTVRHHPVPPARSYDVVPSNYQLSESTINLGYFGAFYDNRGLSDVLTAFMNTPIEVRRRLRLHVFTNRADEFGREVISRGLVGSVLSQGYLPYLEFLNLSTKFDVLIVNDVERSVDHHVNPFLPSKFSDYKGSGAKMWGIVDEGSALSRMDLDYSSIVGSGPSALETLLKIFNDGS